MELILALLLLGLVLISLEILIPGMILGILGGIALIGACALAFRDYGFSGLGYTVIGGGLLLVITLFIEFKMLARTKVGERFFLKSVSGGSAEGKEERRRVREELVGKKGVALSVLAPTGVIEIDGQNYEAYSQSGMIRPGHEVKVVSQDKFRLAVRAL